MTATATVNRHDACRWTPVRHRRCKTAIREVTRAAGVKRVAGELRLSESLVYQWGDPHQAGRNDPLTQLAKMMLLARESGSTGYLAPVYFLIDTFLAPRSGTTTKTELDRRLLQLHREAGELNAAHIDALRDGELDLDEVERMRREAQDVIGRVYAYTLALDCFVARAEQAGRTEATDEAA